MKKLLITGGAGFIGSNFVEYWYNKYPDDKIVVLDLLTYAGRLENIPEYIRDDTNRFEFWYGNVCNTDLVSSLVANVDTIIHFAAESHVTRSVYDSKIFFETDVLGTYSVANAVLKNLDNIELFIHISTSEVYGTSLYKPMDERHPLNPLTPYAAAKAGADRLVYSFIKTYEIPAVILRPFNQYGPKQHLEKMIPRFITSALKDEPLYLHGGGVAERDWLYVDDLCKRIDKVVSNKDKVIGNTFNLGSGFSDSVINIAYMILDYLDKPRDLCKIIGDRPGQVGNHISSMDKAKRILDIEDGRDFKDGLIKTIDWYVANEDWWKSLEWAKAITLGESKLSTGKIVGY